MLRLALAMCGAGLVLAGCRAQADVHSSSTSAGIPEIVSRCIDGREVTRQAENCTMAVEAKVGSQDLQALARYSLAMSGTGSPPPRGIPGPILQCLYTFDLNGRIERCTQAIESGAGSAEMQALAHHARAIAHCWDRHPERSVVDETQAVALVPNFPAAFAHRSECKHALGDLIGARADLAEAIRLDPNVPGYYEEAGMMANLFGAHDEALKDFDYGIRRWPQFNVLFDLRAKTLFNLGRYDEAADAFAQTVKLFPGDAAPVLWLHLSRMNAGQPDAEEFAANTATLELSGWIKPVFDYYQGRIDSRAALQASRSSDDPDAECVAAVFVGEHMLAKQESLGLSHIKMASVICSPNTAQTSRMAAWARLRSFSPESSTARWSR
jgi:tetratricopeptide (TPR) repeat protein